MNKAITIATELNITPHQVEAALGLMGQGATIPFISRYRKEATGSLDEVQLFEIQQKSKRLDELDERRATIIKSIDEQGKLTDELKANIDQATTLSQLEDIYLPYKPKRRTRATVAREAGLEPLALKMLYYKSDYSAENIARPFVKGNIKDTDDALNGACDIIAEMVSENTKCRNAMRKLFGREAIISTHVTKDHIDDKQYVDYHKHESQLRWCPSHRYLAIRRAENEGVLKVSIDVDPEQANEKLKNLTMCRVDRWANPYVTRAINDAYKRLLKPSIENEVSATAKEKADKEAITVFSENLRQLLMSPPLGPCNVMGLDPGYRTGCKVVCLDNTGRLLHHDVIYPVPPHNETAKASATLTKLAHKYNITAISIGNGTASRETEQFVRQTFKDNKNIRIFVVNEAGASVYSASEVARREFPDYDVTVRGAVSIARRLIDPMAELVKIDPKSIGVGQYQHDVNQTALKESLDHTVETCVNSVGVDLNTSSPELLSYVSGIGQKLANVIVEYRQMNGPFASRQDLNKVPRLGNKTFTQAAGFLRVSNGSEPLDNTGIHPERYELVKRMARDSGCTLHEFCTDASIRRSLDLNRYIVGDIGLPTLNDIMAELDKPGRDPRGEIAEFHFDESIKEISDVHTDMLLPGVVNNITAFGAFVDLGIHTNGLIHISQMSDRRISSPSEILKLGQHVTVRVIAVDTQRDRISLKLIDKL